MDPIVAFGFGAREAFAGIGDFGAARGFAGGGALGDGG